MEITSHPPLSTRCIWPASPSLETRESGTPHVVPYGQSGLPAHCAFTDLVRFQDRWLCCFRESDAHALGKLGVIRVLESPDGENWRAAHVFADDGYDLRDPHFSRPGDGRLMINFTGRTQVNGVYEDVQSFAAFTSGEAGWGEAVALEADGYWIWQIGWHEGVAYSWARQIVEGLPYGFFRSRDGVQWERLISLQGGNETAVTPLPDGRLLAFRRRNDAEIGISAAPFLDWTWTPQGRFAGGPGLLVLSDGRVLAGCRFHRPNLPREKKSYFALSLLDPASGMLQPRIEFQGGPDCGYPGLVEHEGEIWVSHYSGTKTESSIYLTRVPTAALDFLSLS